MLFCRHCQNTVFAEYLQRKYLLRKHATKLLLLLQQVPQLIQLSTPAALIYFFLSVRITKHEKNSQCKEMHGYHLAQVLTFSCISNSIALALKHACVYLAQGSSSHLLRSSQFLQYLMELHLFSVIALGFYCFLNGYTLTVKSNIHFVQNFLAPQLNSTPSNKWVLLWCQLYLCLHLSNSQVLHSSTKTRYGVTG